jgi:hypothetical protein
MTMREMFLAIRKISVRTHTELTLDLKFQAALRGIKLDLPLPGEAEEVEPLTAEQKKTHDEHLKKAQERKLREKRNG